MLAQASRLHPISKGEVMLPTRAGTGILAAILLAASLAFAAAEDAAAIKPTVTPVLESSTTIIGQPIAYPAGTAKVTAAIITIPPGGETGWHTHAVPLFGYMLDGELTVDYGSEGTRVYKVGDSSHGSHELAARRHEQGDRPGPHSRRLHGRRRACPTRSRSRNSL